MTFSHITLCFALPRSRTQWLCWLHGRAIAVLHDPLKNCRSVADLRVMIEAMPPGRLFIADTAALLFHDALCEELPGVQRRYVWRSPRLVAMSLARQVDVVDHGLLDAMYARRGSIDQPDGSWCEYDTLDAHAAGWFEAATGQPVPPDYADLCGRVIDTPLRDQWETGDASAFRDLYREREIYKKSPR